MAAGVGASAIGALGTDADGTTGTATVGGSEKPVCAVSHTGRFSASDSGSRR